MRGAFPTGWRPESLARSVPPSFAGKEDPPRTPPRRRFAPRRRARDFLHGLLSGSGGPAGAKAAALGIERVGRHVFLCADAGKPRCCAPEVAGQAWRQLKRRLDELGLANGRAGGEIARTRANCLRICAEGPVAVVYPEGVWYAGLDSEAIEEVIQRHLIGGVPVERLRIPNTRTRSGSGSAPPREPHPEHLNALRS